MKKYINRQKAILIGLILIFISLVLRNVGDDVAITSSSVFFLSVGFGFAFAGLFANKVVNPSEVKKYMLVPLIVAAIILGFKKLQIDMPILQGVLLFSTNILFFKKEIKKALKNQ